MAEGKCLPLSCTRECTRGFLLQVILEKRIVGLMNILRMGPLDASQTAFTTG